MRKRNPKEDWRWHFLSERRVPYSLWSPSAVIHNPAVTLLPTTGRRNLIRLERLHKHIFIRARSVATQEGLSERCGNVNAPPLMRLGCGISDGSLWRQTKGHLRCGILLSVLWDWMKKSGRCGIFFFFCQVTHQSFGSLQLPQVKKPHLIVSAIFFSSPLLVLFSQSLSHSFDLLLFSDKGVRLSASANVKGTIASDTLQEMPRLPASKQMKSPQGAVQVSYWRWHPEKRCTILWKARATYTFFFPLLHSVTSDDPSFALLWNLLCH